MCAKKCAGRPSNRDAILDAAEQLVAVLIRLVELREGGCLILSGVVGSGVSKWVGV